MQPSDIAGRLLFAAAWCLGQLPLSWQQNLGAAVGRLAYRLDLREAKVARRNLELTRPTLAPALREAEVRGILEQTGRNGFESVRVWTRPRAQNLQLIRSIHGATALDVAEQAGRGMIVVAPHYGNLEVVIGYIASRGPLSLVYRVPDSPAGNVFLRLARGASDTTLVPAEGNAMRPLWKALKAGQTVGMTPDQQPKLGAGEFAPFFGVPALTMTLVPRLAERSGAPVFFAYAERRPDGYFDLHVEPAPAAIAAPDLTVALAAMNQAIEGIASRDQRQYQWTYKRYTLRPPGSGEANPYALDLPRTPPHG
ncbi:MAG: lipid A biosynthesis lauroyl acyltransferase [Arenimonas sp.]|nr:lipid A biosynthesis lauroyl acyltransferase [Arenimonas sp.]